MRLDKYLSVRGIGSRSEVKEMIRKGKITVNGKIEKDPGAHVSEQDQVIAAGEATVREEFEYYLLNKPAGMITARTDPEKPVVMSLVPSKRTDLSPVGRLDEDTEGVLLITNDGDLNHRLLSKKYHVEKRYYLETEEEIPQNAAEILEKPIEFEDFTSEPGKYENIDKKSAYLTITEGKFHQVKRMMAKAGCTVKYLRRDEFGPLNAEGLPVGACRKLTNEEIQALKEISAAREENK